MTELEKPSYSTTKNALHWSLALGWLVLIALTCGALYGQHLAVELAWVMAPSMVALIAAILGIHRAFGSMDMRTIAGQMRAPKKRREPQEPREEPA